MQRWFTYICTKIVFSVLKEKQTNKRTWHFSSKHRSHHLSACGYTRLKACCKGEIKNAFRWCGELDRSVLYRNIRLILSTLSPTSFVPASVLWLVLCYVEQCRHQKCFLVHAYTCEQRIKLKQIFSCRIKMRMIRSHCKFQGEAIPTSMS